ncbi:4962_t:CDS:2 [Ambispora gerdemannii]|uniref:4962_t:CDS:1 n=1 Tax=Ambispora gerdemannii TaxID=144530 RepID=A0A9N9F747_9GLOM|nr:4962_t:CDS:2 [Ambispora gerdemannii]
MEQNEVKQPQPPSGIPDLQALRLAALQTLKSRKDTSLALSQDDTGSEREEGELSETESSTEEFRTRFVQGKIELQNNNPGASTLNFFDDRYLDYIDYRGSLDRGSLDAITRQIVSQIYAAGGTAEDMIREGVPLDIILRFSQELNMPTSPYLESMTYSQRFEDSRSRGAGGMGGIMMPMMEPPNNNIAMGGVDIYNIHNNHNNGLSSFSPSHYHQVPPLIPPTILSSSSTNYNLPPYIPSSEPLSRNIKAPVSQQQHNIMDFDPYGPSSRLKDENGLNNYGQYFYNAPINSNGGGATTVNTTLLQNVCPERPEIKMRRNSQPQFMSNMSSLGAHNKNMVLSEREAAPIVNNCQNSGAAAAGVQQTTGLFEDAHDNLEQFVPITPKNDKPIKFPYPNPTPLKSTGIEISTTQFLPPVSSSFSSSRDTNSLIQQPLHTNKLPIDSRIKETNISNSVIEKSPNGSLPQAPTTLINFKDEPLNSPINNAISSTSNNKNLVQKDSTSIINNTNPTLDVASLPSHSLAVNKEPNVSLSIPQINKKAAPINPKNAKITVSTALETITPPLTTSTTPFTKNNITVAPISIRQSEAYQKKFAPNRRTSYIINLSDESDNEQRSKKQSGPVKNPLNIKTKESSVKASIEKLEAKTQLEKKEREIKKLQQIISLKEKLKKAKENSATSIPTVSSATSSNSTATSNNNNDQTLNILNSSISTQIMQKDSLSNSENHPISNLSIASSIPNTLSSTSKIRESISTPSTSPSIHDAYSVIPENQMTPNSLISTSIQSNSPQISQNQQPVPASLLSPVSTKKNTVATPVIQSIGTSSAAAFQKASLGNHNFSTTSPASTQKIPITTSGDRNISTLSSPSSIQATAITSEKQSISTPSSPVSIHKTPILIPNNPIVSTSSAASIQKAISLTIPENQNISKQSSTYSSVQKSSIATTSENQPILTTSSLSSSAPFRKTSSPIHSYKIISKSPASGAKQKTPTVTSANQVTSKSTTSTPGTNSSTIIENLIISSDNTALKLKTDLDAAIKTFDEAEKEDMSNQSKLIEIQEQIKEQESIITATENKLKELQAQLLIEETNKADAVETKHELSVSATNHESRASEISEKLTYLKKSIKDTREKLTQHVNQVKKNLRKTLSESKDNNLNANGKRKAIQLHSNNNPAESSPVKKIKTKSDNKSQDVLELVKKKEEIDKLLEENRRMVAQHIARIQVVAKGKSASKKNEPQETIDYPHFKTYESPLRQFRSYRFHPNYLEMVSDGYKSLTFSHNIEHQKPFCVFETFPGGVCNDEYCQSQHFRDITMTEEKIIADMASYVEGTDVYLRQTYRNDVAQLIKEYKANGSTDFNGLIEVIVAYRRDFLGKIERYQSFESPRIICFTKEKIYVDGEEADQEVDMQEDDEEDEATDGVFRDEDIILEDASNETEQIDETHNDEPKGVLNRIANWFGLS